MSIASIVATAIHRIKHLLRLHPCKLVEIVHAPDCLTGFCLSDRVKQCDWHAKVQCSECGKVEFV